MYTVRPDRSSRSGAMITTSPSINSTGQHHTSQPDWPAMLPTSSVLTRMWLSPIPRGRPRRWSIISSNTASARKASEAPAALAAALLITLASQPFAARAASCTHKGVELQVLGSGGPELEDHRASTSYLVWRDGRPEALIDSGGGSALQFGRSGAHVSELDAVFFTHLHIDHTADFPTLIKSSYFE